MKSVVAVIAAFVVAGNAWDFTACGANYNGENSFACTAKTCAIGSQISFSQPQTEPCAIRIYDDAACVLSIGGASNDWNSTLTQTMRSFDIRGC